MFCLLIQCPRWARVKMNVPILLIFISACCLVLPPSSGVRLLWLLAALCGVVWERPALRWRGGAGGAQAPRLDGGRPQLHLPAAEQVGWAGKLTRRVQVRDELWGVYYGTALRVASDQKREQNRFGAEDLPRVWQPALFVRHSGERRGEISHVELGQLVLRLQKVACNYWFGNF